MNIQKITLKIFFPAMYLCAGFALLSIWTNSIVQEGFFRLIPTFFIIGLATFITWVVSVTIELKNIAKAKK